MEHWHALEACKVVLSNKRGEHSGKRQRSSMEKDIKESSGIRKRVKVFGVNLGR
jgi:hypothetical protein